MKGGRDLASSWEEIESEGVRVGVRDRGEREIVIVAPRSLMGRAVFTTYMTLHSLMSGKYVLRAVSPTDLSLSLSLSPSHE